jgi:hypothetical protein
MTRGKSICRGAKRPRIELLSKRCRIGLTQPQQITQSRNARCGITYVYCGSDPTGAVWQPCNPNPLTTACAE